MEAMIMNQLDGVSLAWLYAGIEVLGLLSACLVRVEEGSRREGATQSLFLWILALMGGATLLSLSLEPGYWLSCAAVLCLMVLAAVWDPRKTGHLTDW